MRQRWPDQINVRGLATITEAISCPSATLFSFSEVAAHRPAMGILMLVIGRDTPLFWLFLVTPPNVSFIPAI
jgi:hypothetical protein